MARFSFSALLAGGDRVALSVVSANQFDTPNYWAQLTAMSIGESLDITPEQCRAARGWLYWKAEKAAEAIGVDIRTIYRFERGEQMLKPEARLRLLSVFLAAGIEFRPEGGLRGPRLIERQRRPVGRPRKAVAAPEA